MKKQPQELRLGASTGPTVAPDSVMLLERSDSNFVGDEWTWNAFVSRRKDGRFTCSLIQTVKWPPKSRVPGLVGFRKGEALFGYLVQMWGEHAGEDLKQEDWEAVANSLAQFDCVLGLGFTQGVEDYFDPPPPPPPGVAEMHALQALKAFFDAEPRATNPITGMGYAMRRAQQRDAAVSYAKRYLEEHRTLPVGVHRIGPNLESNQNSFELLFPPKPDDFVPPSANRKRGSAAPARASSHKRTLSAEQSGKRTKGT